MGGPVKKYVVAEVVAEARLNKPAIVLDFGEGREFKIDPPELWGDEVMETASAGEPTKLTKLLLGDQYDAYKEAGGQNSTINLVLEQHRAALGESSRSSTSSGSTETTSSSIS